MTYKTPKTFKLSAWEFFCRSSQASIQNNCPLEGPGFCHSIGCLLYEYHIPHTALSATNVFQGPVYPIGELHTVKIIIVDFLDGEGVVGKFSITFCLL